MTEINVPNLDARAAFPWLRRLAPVAVMGVIFFFSAQPYDGHEIAWWEVVARNLGHFLGYALLAAAWLWALPGSLGRRIAAAAALSLAYAVGDEHHQTFVEGRTGTAADVLIDALGIAAAALIAVNRRPRAAKD